MMAMGDSGRILRLSTNARPRMALAILECDGFRVRDQYR